MEITEMTALELGISIQKRELSAVEAAEAFLSKIESSDGIINAYISVLREDALSRAAQVQKKIEAGELSNPLAGVPVAVKDNICTRGVRTTCASKILGDFRPPYDATLMERLNGSGAVLLGKLNMDEFAMGSTSETSFFGPVKNPWKQKHVPGGSSGGAAAAVALERGNTPLVPIRRFDPPACLYCGVTGMKPTYGTVSRYGLIAYASSLDQMGPVARSRRLRGHLDIICGKDRRDATSLDHVHGSYLARLTGDLRE
jgi:aspartyl-tRNA(Asn)/glutamyl-tRNA(Gln) amidotransferase subunit A